VPDVAAALFAPLAFHPNGSAMGRTGVVTVDPDITVAIPAVIAGNPDPALVDWSGHNFDGTWGRWPDPDHDLRVSDADREEEAAHCSEKLFLHLSFSF
jgi:hypothetical protein